MSGYMIDVSSLDHLERDLVCRTIMRMMGAKAGLALVDAYVDSWLEKVMPRPASEALERLRASGEKSEDLRRGEDPWMAVLVMAEDASLWADAAAFAAWSINVDVINNTGGQLANFHDGAAGISVRLSESELASLSLSDLVGISVE